MSYLTQSETSVLEAVHSAPLRCWLHCRPSHAGQLPQNDQLPPIALVKSGKNKNATYSCDYSWLLYRNSPHHSDDGGVTAYTPSSSPRLSARLKRSLYVRSNRAHGDTSQ